MLVVVVVLFPAHVVDPSIVAIGSPIPPRHSAEDVRWMPVEMLL